MGIENIGFISHDAALYDIFRYVYSVYYDFPVYLKYVDLQKIIYSFLIKAILFVLNEWYIADIVTKPLPAISWYW